MDEVAAGVTVVSGGTYAPSGLFYGNEDYEQDGNTVTIGDTVAVFISPSGEMLGKLNLSGGLSPVFADDFLQCSPVFWTTHSANFPCTFRTCSGIK